MESSLPPMRLPCARCIAQLTFSSCTQLSVFTLSELWEHCAVEHSGLSPLFHCSLCSFSSFSPVTATKHSAVCSGNCRAINTAPSPLENVLFCESIVDDSLRIFLRSTSAAVAETRPCSNRERDAETDTLGAQSEGVEQEEKEKEQSSDTIESAPLRSIKQEPPEGPVEEAEAEKPKETMKREAMRKREKVVAEKEKEKPLETSKSAPLTLHIKKEPIEDPSSEKSRVAERTVGEGETRKEKRKERKRSKRTGKQQSSLSAPETTKRIKQEIIHPVNEKEECVEEQREKEKTPAAQHIIILTTSVCTVKEKEQGCTAEEEKSNVEPERREPLNLGIMKTKQQVVEKEQNEEKEEKTGQETAKEQTTKCGEKRLSAETAVSIGEPLLSANNVAQVEHGTEEKKSEETEEPPRVTPVAVVGLAEKEQEKKGVVVEQLTEKADPLFLKVDHPVENESSGGVDEGIDSEDSEEEEEGMPPPYNYDSEGTIEVSDDEEKEEERESPPCEIDVIVLSSDDDEEMERLQTAPPTPLVYCPDRVKPEPVDNYVYRSVDVTVKMEVKQETKTRKKRKRRIDTMEEMSVAREVREGQARLFSYEWNKLEKREYGREEKRVVGGEKPAPREEVEDYVDRGPPKRFKIVECGGKDGRRDSADSGVSLDDGRAKRKRDSSVQKRVYGRGAIAERSVRGTVLVFHKSHYTFIERSDSEGKPVFVHISQLPGIVPGTWVVFDTEWDVRKGGRRLCACNVRPVCM